MPSSKNSVLGSISLATRSRAVSRFFLCCAFDGLRAAALADLFFLVLDLREAVHHARVFCANAGDLRSTWVSMTGWPGVTFTRCPLVLSRGARSCKRQ